MNLQIETIKLADGSRIDVIRDIEAVRRLTEKCDAMRSELERLRDLMCGEDAAIIDEVLKL